ncbi:MAG TPA: TRAP transporter small permease [Xanthobacteraceae bacterium]|jgi:C4-dicarboxylate transporter DctQ subunit|nr:TRAP transporter small permease [Xanthobacteraceae bacterium]
MREALRRGATALTAALRVAAGTMLMLSVGINFANIIGRYVFSVSLYWAEEAMLFLMIGCVFFGASQAGWLNRHIRMDVVISLLPPRARKAFDVLADLVTIATCIAVASFAWPVMTMLYELDQRSETANIPLVIPQSVVPIGLLLMALLIAVRLVAVGVRHDDVIAGRDLEH